ncbi:MAG: Zn-dependent protease/predicted transcriptional regulator [Methanobacteriota archaeon]|jgi:Zn-dependent protease/predicted transcriptional regulator|uniref:Zinc metalloprotease n=1 Tax=Halorutilus salinus TaxID=2487751 RepID=A0A9Q4C464_9EURY|nr:CBS domain-containing protein [Halorutilus salinus]MCX2819537.1 CBS domain-containing protein [Halorutilus salinus]
MWNYRVVTVTGIPIRVNITLLLFIPVIVWLIGSNIGTPQGAEIWVDILSGLSDAELSAEQLRGGNTPWLLGALAAVGLFFGVTVHELGHAWTARRYDLEISSITLWIFGGMAHMEENPTDWRTEFWIAVAGPITSVVVAGAFYVALQAVPSVPALVFVFGWLTIMNVVLAVFNMVPAFPMDGGRVLRALLARNRPYAKATQSAATVAKFLAVAMGILGLLGNPVLILIALFVYVAASSESRMTAISESLTDVTVADLMTREVSTVSPEDTVQELFDRMLVERHTGYPVVRNGNVVGIVTLSDAKEVRPEEREAFVVEEIMTEDIVTVEPGEDAFEVLQTISRESFGRLVVVEDGDLVGIVSRTDIMTALDVLEGGGMSRQPAESV